MNEKDILGESEEFREGVTSFRDIFCRKFLPAIVNFEFNHTQEETKEFLRGASWCAKFLLEDYE